MGRYRLWPGYLSFCREMGKIKEVVNVSNSFILESKGKKVAAMYRLKISKENVHVLPE